MMDILIVEDDKAIASGLLELISMLDCKGQIAKNPENAETISNFNDFDIAIIDYNLNAGITGLGVMVKLKRKNPNIICIVMTANPSVETAVDAMKLGAYDFITKPFDIAKLERVIDSIQMLRAKDRIANVESKETKDNNTALNANLYDLKREAIVKAIEESETLQEAANKLGIDKVTLYRQRIKLGLIKKTA